ncbi:MAG: hypothetical protein WAV78_29225, partial [Xanthobacteraceae bacterium]
MPAGSERHDQCDRARGIGLGRSFHLRSHAQQSYHGAKHDPHDIIPEWATDLWACHFTCCALAHDSSDWRYYIGPLQFRLI